MRAVPIRMGSDSRTVTTGKLTQSTTRELAGPQQLSCEQITCKPHHVERVLRSNPNEPRCEAVNLMPTSPSNYQAVAND